MNNNSRGLDPFGYMWPWEHLAIGYLLYSATSRVGYDRAPSDHEAVVLAVGTQFPDLIDKPGSWVFGVLPSGTSVAHSVFTAVAVTLVGLGLARRSGIPELGVAFGIGYLSHLFGDVFYSVLLGGRPAFGAVLWPFGPAYAGNSRGILERVAGFFMKYADYLLSPVGLGYLLAEVAFLAAAVAVWTADGNPGTALFRHVWRKTRRWARSG